MSYVEYFIFSIHRQIMRQHFKRLFSYSFIQADANLIALKMIDTEI